MKPVLSIITDIDVANFRPDDSGIKGFIVFKIKRRHHGLYFNNSHIRRVLIVLAIAGMVTPPSHATSIVIRYSQGAIAVAADGIRTARDPTSRKIVKTELHCKVCETGALILLMAGDATVIDKYCGIAKKNPSEDLGIRFSELVGSHVEMMMQIVNAYLQTPLGTQRIVTARTAAERGMLQTVLIRPMSGSVEYALVELDGMQYSDGIHPKIPPFIEACPGTYCREYIALGDGFPKQYVIAHPSILALPPVEFVKTLLTETIKKHARDKDPSVGGRMSVLTITGFGGVQWLERGECDNEK